MSPRLPPSTASDALAIRRVEPAYPPPEAAPYDPDTAFPELPAAREWTEEDGHSGSLPKNHVFSAVRDLLCDLQLDVVHYGTPAWNPLGDLVPPGATILVKPNWVLHHNENPAGGMDCMITHPAVLRAVLEYAFLARPALVILGDAPLQGCDFGVLQRHAGLDRVVASFRARGLPLAVADFRRTILDPSETPGPRTVREHLRAEADYVLVDLGAESLLEPVSDHWRRFRVTMYDPRLMAAHHRPGVHQYLLAREALSADLVLNCPKLKTHKKAGLTCCLKNLIGINGNKEYLPHHRKGATAAGRGGDSHPRQSLLVDCLESALDLINRHRDWAGFYAFGERWIYRAENHLVRRHDPDAQMEGNWAGNDTIWRTCLDLNRALLYADAEGHFHDAPIRQELSIVDAVVAGQGDGPLAPTPLPTGALFAARNPALGDLMAALLLGFEPDRIPMVAHALDAFPHPLVTLPAAQLLDGARTAFASAEQAGPTPFPPALPPPNWPLR
ncbi:MAG: DUF362 domain-containing protein [Kiritimatiellae bacterium]|nr:DUF362 domain-containing protein [Kiritimatiellia bacterium]